MTPREHGTPLSTFLAERYPHTAPEAWRQRILAGRVTVDGLAASPERRLERGERITWHRPPWTEPDAPLEIRTLHVDEHLLAVVKPAGLPTLPGAGFLENTLSHRVGLRYPGAAPAHRLGRWTAGIVLFGRTAAARAGLAKSFRERRVRKRYLALVAGRPRWRRRRIAVPVGPVPYPPLGTVHAASMKGRPAVSHATRLRTTPAGTYCAVEIASGRPHQIRIHLAAAGHPLAGDPLYAAGGRPGAGGRALPGDPGYDLRAVGVHLTHPASGEALEIRWQTQLAAAASSVSAGLIEST